MRTLRPGLDFHRVIANTQFYRQKILWRSHKIHISDPHLIQREILVDQLQIMTPEAFTEHLEEMYADPEEFVENVYPYPGAIEMIHEHCAHGDQAFIITASGDEAFRCCVRWCASRYLGSSILRVYSSGKNGSKVDLARRFRLTSQLDDGLKNLIELRDDKTISTRPIWMQRTHQATPLSEDLSQITIVNNLVQYRSIITQMREAP